MAIVHRLLSPVVQVREEESTTLLLMFLYSFLAMTAYTFSNHSPRGRSSLCSAPRTCRSCFWRQVP